MYEELKQNTEIIEEQEKVLVPVRRCQADKQAEQEIQQKPEPVKKWERPRRWYIY